MLGCCGVRQSPGNRIGVDRGLTQRFQSQTMNIAILGAALVALLALIRHMPIGRLHGQRVFLKDLLNPSVRLGLRVSFAEKLLATCMDLPPKERLPKLLELERRFSGVFVVGDKIRSGVIGTGLDDSIPHLRRIMNQSLKGPGNVVTGIQAAMQSEALEEGYRINAIKLLIDGLGNQSLFGVYSRHLPELLILLDKEWASRILAEICEREQNHFLFTTTLDTLRAYRLPVDPGVAEAVLADSQDHGTSKVDLLKRVSAAKLLHETDPTRAQAVLEKMVETQPSVAGEAAEALLELRDLPHPRFLLDDLQGRLGLAALGEAERIAWHADCCGYFLGMDFLYRFDSEEEGDQLCEMHQAVVQVGAAKTAAKLKAYMDLYGPEGPPATVAERHSIATSKGEAWNESIMSLDQLHDTWEDVTSLAIQYILRHSEQFHSASEIRTILNRPNEPSALNR